MGGVINFVTHRSLLDTRTSAGLSLQTRGATPGGSWNTSARFKYISPRVGFEIGGGLGGLEELVTAQGPIANSGDKEQFFSGRLALGLGRSVLDYEHTRNAATDIGLPAFSNSSGSYGRYPLQSRQADRLEWTLPGRGGAPDFKVLGVLQDFQTKFDESITDSVFNRGRFIAQRTEESKDDVGTWSWSVQPTLRYSRLANLRLNGEYRREVTSGPRMTETIVENAAGVVTSDTFEERESMPPAQRSVWSAGASVAPVVRTVRFEGGLRWDRLHSVADSTENSNTSKLDVTDERVSGEVGVARAFGGFEPYVHLATGFRAPNLQERYYNDDIHGGLRLFGNPDLSAERSTSYEAGLRLNDVGPFPSMRVSAYRSDVRDMITFEYIDMLYGTPRFQYLNVERARVQGVEAQAQLRTGALNWAVSVTLPHAEDLETGEPLTDAGTARTTVDLGFPVRRLLPMGQLAVRWRWNDAVISDDPTLARPSFHTTAVEVSMIHAGVRAVFAVRNLFDAYYTEPLSFIPEAGRTFALSLRYDYNLALPLARND
jgi:outer membrane receptor protein involved in Fe transport